MQRSDLLHSSKSFEMKVELTKAHPLGKEGEIKDVPDGLGKYLKSVGAAKKASAKKETDHEEKDKPVDHSEQAKEEKPKEKSTKEDKGAKDITTKDLKIKAK